MKRLILGCLALALICAPAAAANKTPLANYGGGALPIKAGDTLLTPAPTTANASINLPHGTAPSSPTNGDCWTTTGGLYCRINGATVGPMSSGGTGTVTTTGSPASGNLAKFSGATSITNTTLSAFLDSEFSSTQGAVIYRGFSAWAALAPGTSGQVLQTSGTGANPSWGSVAGGGSAGYTYTAPAFASVSALLHFNGTNGSTTITDQVAGNTWTAVGGAAISTAQSAFGGASLLVAGASNSSIKMPTSSKYDVGTGDWAIEFRWRYSGAPQTSARIFQTRDGDVFAGLSVLVNSTSQIQLYLSSNGSSFDILNGNIVASMTQGSWNAVIIQRRGGFIETYLNGALVTILLIDPSASIYYNSSDTVIIGGNATSSSRSMNAYIDEFRFTKGAYVALPSLLGYPSAAFPDS